MLHYQYLVWLELHLEEKFRFLVLILLHFLCMFSYRCLVENDPLISILIFFKKVNAFFNIPGKLFFFLRFLKCKQIYLPRRYAFNVNMAFIYLGIYHISVFFLLNDHGILLRKLFLRLAKGAPDCVVIVQVHLVSRNYPCKLIN